MKKLNFLFLLLVAVSCENRNPGTSSAGLDFNLTGNVQGEGILIDSAMIFLKSIDLKIKYPFDNEAHSPSEFHFSGPYEINLLEKKSSPDIPAEIIPGVYSGLDAELYVPKNRGYSMYVSGTYTRNGEWWKFIYTYTEGGSFRIENEDGITITANSKNYWVLIDAAGLFAGVDFSTARADADNIIRISGSSNASLALAISGNFVTASEITGEDPGNGNGETGSGNGNGGTGTGNSSPPGGSGSSGSPGQAGHDTGSGQGSSASGPQDNHGSAAPGQDDPGKASSGKDKEKEKDKDKNKEKEKEKGKDKDNNKNKDRDKNKDKGKDKG